jgi:hypothetical protein
MVTWTRDELTKIAAAEELELASVRRDDTLGNPVTIWVVRVGDDLYVRSWKGDAGAWFRATQVRHAGHIEAGGVGKDVTFVAETADDVNDRIDAAYRTKYRRHGGRYVDPMVASTARATTIKLVPRSSAGGGATRRGKAVNARGAAQLGQTAPLGQPDRGSTRPAPAMRFSSSNAAETTAELCKDFIYEVPCGLGGRKRRELPSS